MIENSRKNAIDSARATYGDKADIVGIQRTYDTIANTIDPKLTDVTDMISMSIDNHLHGSQNVKMLMPNGSIRTMDADVAMALSDMPKRSSGITKQMIHRKQKRMQQKNCLQKCLASIHLRKLRNCMNLLI